MNILKCFFILTSLQLSVCGVAQPKLKLDRRDVAIGETLNYKAYWGFFNIGSATTRIDRTLYKIGSHICYKIDIAGQTNGLADLFYVRDKWTAYIDTAAITTHQSYRSIREGRYELDEQVFFDHINKKAEVRIYDKAAKLFVQKQVYDTPENIRDVIAGFMVFRLVDLSKYKKGQVFTINGFYEDEGYKIDVVFRGEEYVKNGNSKTLCYKLEPIVPKNKVFDGKDAVVVWLSADKSKRIIRIHARLYVGKIQIELQS